MGSTTGASTLPPPTPAQNARHGTRTRSSGSGDENGHVPGGPTTKRPRLVFTDIQKRTLQAIFKETQRPSREMQQTIAEHLRLDMSTVSNFFMNARRRSRNGQNIGDEPAPYQQVITHSKRAMGLSDFLITQWWIFFVTHQGNALRDTLLLRKFPALLGSIHYTSTRLAPTALEWCAGAHLQTVQ